MPYLVLSSKGDVFSLRCPFVRSLEWLLINSVLKFPLCSIFLSNFLFRDLSRCIAICSVMWYRWFTGWWKMIIVLLRMQLLQLMVVGWLLEIVVVAFLDEWCILWNYIFHFLSALQLHLILQDASLCCPGLYIGVYDENLATAVWTWIVSLLEDMALCAEI